MSEVPSDLLYDHEQHLWFEVDGDEAKVGITDFAQDQMGEIMFVELPELDSFQSGDYLMCLESSKKDQDISAPFTLEVIEVNEELEDSPEKINEDPYDAWICRVRIIDEDELDDLVESDEYEERVDELASDDYRSEYENSEDDYDVNYDDEMD